MTIINWLNKPYPFVTNLKSKLLISFLFGFFIYVFLLVFQPFGLDKIIASKALYILGFGIITTVVILFAHVTFPLLFAKTFNPEKWNIGKEIFFITFIIAIITIANYNYNSIVGYDFAQQHGLLFFILITVSVGFFPVTILVFSIELFLNKKHQKTALKLNEKFSNVHNPTNNKSKIIINSDSKNEHLEIGHNDLLFIKSEDNYCKVYFESNNKLATKLIRASLKSIEKQFELHTNIIRCHRSFIVNKKQILKITGNARAYYLHFKKCDETVPISRNFKKDDLI